ncbi:hypothetical protein L211DRAFT_804467 [Terfezia boudieri ATCC MYA-4762]|uniref:NADH-ubiquinone oxidoreductase B12 subunit n=1 Tax=Terfezia boudieri ATCC MYA-4762 TaxID=1051890 RepID=A0A3N4LYW0_9PEZI|nr:hypothetical protein L211DRAFT_804467 [Terfezia boudieri ATCC MYA-4762]
MSQRPGFDPKSFDPTKHLLNTPPRKDPWARGETWRYAGPFTRWNRFKMALPGLGTATVAFAAYCAYEALFMKDDHQHGGEHHGKDHH